MTREAGRTQAPESALDRFVHPDQGVVYRPDIDGLRALAIVVVVLYHAGVRGFGGGFVGVDVFFVISGWLITQQLLFRSATDGRVPLLDFWARRIRRLVPAAFAMVVGTTVLSLLLLSPLDWRLIAQRGIASALYVSNLLFAARAGDYFSGPLKDSPYLHTWSLAVEEQFYLVWPLLIALVVVAARRKLTPGLRRGLVVAMASVFLVSMAVNLQQTNSGSPWAFFGLPARAWEFAAAGLMATLVYGRRGLPRRYALPLASMGLLLVLGSVLWFDSSTPWPGLAATVPVGGSLLVLLAGHQRPLDDVVTRSLSCRPIVAIGLLSYSWYLWHWPLMVIAVGAIYRDTVLIRLVAALVALGIAALSYRFVENPVRYSSSLRRSIVKTYALGAALTVGAVAVSGGLLVYERHQIEQSPYREYEAARQSYQDTGCQAAVSPRGVSYCEGGALDSERVVMLVGDSHAGQWMRAFSNVGADLGLRVVLRATGNCPATPMLTGSGNASPQERHRGCGPFQRDTHSLISEIEPVGVVLADANVSKERVFGESAREWRAAVERQVSDLNSAGVPVGLVVDAPLSNDPLLCLARGRSREHCTLGHDAAMELVRRYARATQALRTRSGVATLDVNGSICRQQECRIEVDGTWVFAAFEHLTGDFTMTHEPQIGAFLHDLGL